MNGADPSQPWSRVRPVQMMAIGNGSSPVVVKPTEGVRPCEARRLMPPRSKTVRAVKVAIPVVVASMAVVEQKKKAVKRRVRTRDRGFKRNQSSKLLALSVVDGL